MRISFNRQSMLDAIAAVSPATPARSPKPVLVNTKLVVTGDGEAVLSATDFRRF